MYQVESLLNDNNSDVLNFENIHGRANRTILAKDLDLGKFAPNGLPVEVKVFCNAWGKPAVPYEQSKIKLALEISMLFLL